MTAVAPCAALVEHGATEGPLAIAAVCGCGDAAVASEVASLPSLADACCLWIGGVRAICLVMHHVAGGWLLRC